MDIKQKNFNKRNETIQYLQVAGSILKLRFVVIMLIAFLSCPTMNFAQDTFNTPLPVDLNDTLQFSKEQKGLFNKLALILKFKENRNNKEKERIYKFMLNLIKDQNLSIDSNMNELSKILDSLIQEDSIKIDRIDQRVLNSKATQDSLSAITIDSIKATLDTVFKKRMEHYFVDQKEVDSAKSLSEHIKKEAIQTDPINSVNRIVILLAVLVFIAICVFLLYRKYG